MEEDVSLPNHQYVNLFVVYLRKTYKEESARPKEAANNLFPPRAVHVTIKEDAMLPVIRH